MATKQLVEELIKGSVLVCFSKSYCPYCTRVKNIFPSLKVPTKVIELDQEANGAEIQSYLADKTGQRTVPNIFINQKHVGGCDDFLKLQSSGELQKLLA